MNPFANPVTALAVSAIYLVWRSYRTTRLRDLVTLHRRVAFMLWISATAGAESEASAV
jgi:hypothetical protein